MTGEKLISILESGMILSVLLINLFFSYIKYLLFKRGLKVNWILEWGKDYFRLKDIAESESNKSLKKKYIFAINGLKLSFLSLIFIVIIGIVYT